MLPQLPVLELDWLAVVHEMIGVVGDGVADNVKPFVPAFVSVVPDAALLFPHAAKPTMLKAATATAIPLLIFISLLTSS